MKRIKLTSLKIRNFDRMNDDVFVRYKYSNKNELDVICYEIHKLQRGLYKGEFTGELKEMYHHLTSQLAKYYKNPDHWLTKVEAAKLLNCHPRKIDAYYQRDCIRAEAVDTSRGEALTLRYCKNDIEDLKEEIDAKTKN